MIEFAVVGSAFYALAEACQDRYLDILMHRAAETGQTVESEEMPWAAGLER